MNSKGFTLIEMLATVAIIGVLLSITTVSVVGYIKSSRENTNIVENTAVISAAQIYLKEKGSWDTNEEACIKISDLKKYGYLQADKDFGNAKAVKFKRDQNSKVITEKKICTKEDCSG